MENVHTKKAFFTFMTNCMKLGEFSKQITTMKAELEDLDNTIHSYEDENDPMCIKLCSEYSKKNIELLELELKHNELEHEIITFQIKASMN